MLNISEIGRYVRKKYKKEIQINYRKNHQITAPTVLLIDENQDKLGEFSTKKAIEMAEEKGLDLIEVAPNAKPPVTKIMSWSKFKYDQSKKRKESKNKSIEQKEMWFKVNIEQGDLDHKLKRVTEFLSKKHPVKLTIRPRGRVHRDNITDLMDRILEQIKDDISDDFRPKFEGRNYAAIVKPNK